MTTRSFRALLISLYVLAIGVPLLTALIITFGPDPVLRSSKYLSPGIVGLQEIRDQIALVSWWVLTGLAGLIVHRSFSSRPDDLVEMRSDSRLWLVPVSFAASLFLAGLVVQLDTAETDNWKRVEFSVVAISLLIVVAVTSLPRLRRDAQTAIQVFFAVVLATCLAALFQSPATIKDVSHFIYTSNELLAPAAGLYPLSNFVATYNNLLGFPITPFVRMFPDSAMSIVVGYLLLLQLLCLSVPALVARIAGRPKLALPMTLLPVVLVTSANDNGNAQNTYFQTFPMRSAVPSLLLVSLVWIISRSKGIGKIESFFLGAFAAISVVNNPDFGGPAAVATLIVMVLYETSLSQRVRTVVFAAIGGVASLAALWTAYSIVGQTLRPQMLLQFTRMVSSGGYMKAAMPIGGIPVVLVTGFSLGVAFGVYSFGRAHRANDRRLLASAAFLLFSSVWGLLSYIYYVGRSYTSTALGGHSYQLGLVISGAILCLVLDAKDVRDQLRSVGAPGFVLPVVALAFISFSTSAYLTVPSPLTSVNSFRSRGAQFALQESFVDEFQVLRQRGILRESPENIGLLLPISNALQQSGVGRSILVTMHPEFTELMPDIAKLQCKEVVESDVELIVEEVSRTSVLEIPQCKDILRGTLKLEYQGVVFRLLRRSDIGVATP